MARFSFFFGEAGDRNNKKIMFIVPNTPDKMPKRQQYDEATHFKHLSGIGARLTNGREQLLRPLSPAFPSAKELFRTCSRSSREHYTQYSVGGGVDQGGISDD